eukprot:Skav222519  [mRNA]  locus=scaffold2265:359570:365510:- [translate_table: standard]
MAHCRLCRSVPSESDGLCPLCRSIHRLVRDFLSVPLDHREWALDRCRSWSGTLQDEVLRLQGNPVPKPNPGATSKASSYLATLAPAPKSGSAGGERDRHDGEEDEKEESPARPRSSGTHRRRKHSTSRRRSRTPVKDRQRHRDSRRREPEKKDRYRPEERGKEKKRRSEEEPREERGRRRREEEVPPEPPGPPPGKWRGKIPAKGEEASRKRKRRGVMAPKLRRPAAVAGRAKAKAKALPVRRGAPVRGARRARLRRPAAEEERQEEEGKDLLSGEVVPADKVPLEQLTEGLEVVVEGTYWGAEAKVCGKVKGIQVQKDGRKELQMSGEGTTHEDLLKWLSTPDQSHLRIHLCGTSCEQRIDAPGLVHGRVIRLKKEEDRGTWAENMQGMEDELKALREAEELSRREAERRPEDEAVKDKKRKEAKRRSVSREKGESKKEKKAAKKTVKIEGKKPLETVYKNTGLDPAPKTRKRILKAVKKRVKKKKKRGPQGEEHGETGTWNPHCGHGEGDAIATSHVGRQSLEPIGGRSSTYHPAVLPPGSSPQDEWRTSTRSSNFELHHRPVAARRHCKRRRLIGTEAEKPRLDECRVELDGGSEGGISATGTRIAELTCRSEGGRQRIKGGRQDKGLDQRKRARKRRLKLLLERERKARRQREERQERREERAEGGGEEVRGKPKIEGPIEEDEKKRDSEKQRVEELLERGAEDAPRLLRQGGATAEEQQPRGVSFKEACEEPQFFKEIFQSREDSMAHGSGAESAPAEESSRCVVDLQDGPLLPSAINLDRRVREKKSESGTASEDVWDMMGDISGKPLFSTAPVVGSLLKKYGSLQRWYSKTQSKGDVFPLPTSTEHLQGCVDLDEDGLQVLVNLVMALNSYAGSSLESTRRCSLLQRKFLNGLAEDVKRMQNWKHTFEDISWDSYFKYRGVDYAGDEVATAQYTSWNNLRSAIPREVGSVDLSTVCEGGCRSYVLDFDNYLVDEGSRCYTKPPRVMVPDSAWEGVCAGLLEHGICKLLPESALARVDDKLLLNGLFGVSKGEVVGGYEVHRLIMNLVPLNNIARGIQGDISTLPSWSAATPLSLLPNQNLVISSEDVRCFFYIFKLPSSWYPYLGFNKVVPAHLHPHSSERHYLVATVLPMGFKNSVALAQHVHRVVLGRASRRVDHVLQPQQEMRKDRIFSNAEHLHRIYLDNFDTLHKMDRRTADLVAGKPSAAVLALRQEYQHIGIPINEKKSVSQSTLAEVQGALVDGETGIAMPKPEKVLKYVQLSLLLLHQHRCSQRQIQVVAGGLVYMATFRRSTMGALNSIWTFVEEFNKHPAVVHLEIPGLVKLELCRFLALLPLARLSFRYEPSPVVTASDASTQGGGVTVSSGLTNAGQIAACCSLRGDVVEPNDSCSILTIGLFDGIGALRVAADSAGLPVCGHISIESNKAASRVLESKFPATKFYDDVTTIDQDIVKQWACAYTMAAVVVIGAGPPCQGVSGLNSERRGALRDHRSNLFVHVPRIRDLVKQEFKWAQVHYLAESVQSMDEEDRWYMSNSFRDQPWSIDASGVSLARRPRLYWCSWEIHATQGAVVTPPLSDEIHDMGKVEFQAELHVEDYITPGWTRGSEAKLPTFTTSRPRPFPGRKPAGIDTLDAEEYNQWVQDDHRFPPYQYQRGHQVWRGSEHRLVNVEEREVIMGFPRHFTLACLPKSQQGSVAHNNLRLSLIGNSWNITVITWLLSQLGAVLGVSPSLSAQECVERTRPGTKGDLPTFLSRPRLGHVTKKVIPGNEQVLVRKLTNMISIKGEDLLVSANTEENLKYHRLRASLPSNLWRWRIVSGWKWKGDREHINVLELRAVLCAMKWRIIKGQAQGQKMVHLTDSLVCLHSLTRGRTSSKKLRRTLARINSLLLLSNNVGVWAYVHTSLNPADAPSREHHRKRKWARR